MKTWTLAGVVGRLCGRCGVAIAPDAPVCLLRLTPVRREFVRCATCAAEPFPAVLPSTSERQVPLEPGDV